jgi:hypothetical protein
MVLREKKTTHLFISHNTKDKPFVRRLAKDLSICGLRCWVDEAEICAGDSLIQKIGDTIESIDYVLVVLSQNSVSSEWVTREVNIALTQEIKSKKIKVLPVLLDNCPIPPFLQDKLYLNFTNTNFYINSLQDLLTGCGIYIDKEKPGWKSYKESNQKTYWESVFYFNNEHGFMPIGIIPLDTSTRFINVIYLIEKYLVIDFDIPSAHITLFKQYDQKKIMISWKKYLESLKLPFRKLYIHVFDPNEFDSKSGVEMSFQISGFESKMVEAAIEKLVGDYNQTIEAFLF